MTQTLAALEGGCPLLTVNKRLASELRHAYDQQQLAAGRRAWPSADILPWNAWLQRLYEQLLDSAFTDRDLLSPHQEKRLWQQIVADTPDIPELLRPAAAAESARSSYALLQQWQLGQHPLASLGSDQTRSFLAWRDRFEDRLRHDRLLSPAELPALLRDAFAQAVLPIPEHLWHSGFEALTPVQVALFETLRSAGCEVLEYRAAPCAADRTRVEAADDEQEIRWAAAWAREQVRAAPQARIGIVSIQITERRRDLERIFREALAPDDGLVPGTGPLPFNLSLGEPLADYPLVAQALLALGLAHGERPLAEVGQLLRSPFLGGHSTECGPRAALDARLREDGQPQITLAGLRRRLAAFDEQDPRRCPDLATRLANYADTTEPARATPARWAAVLQQRLKHLGWPGDQPLDSAEYQQYERFKNLFGELAALGKTAPAWRRAQALSELRTLAGDTLFQAQSPPAAIQILGPLEAAGLRFDALWLLGMQDRHWPPAPRPDPLLPIGLQRELGMPHASAARELAFATSLTARLAEAAPQVIASHAQREADRELRVSPLLQDWPVLAVANQPWTDCSPLAEACSVIGERDALPPPRVAATEGQLQGGAALLAAQAACPFRAVAQYRLRAQPLAEPSHTLDAALIGSLVHSLLQRVWQHLGDSETLAGYDDSALRAQVTTLANASLDAIGRRRPDLFGPRARALECARLTDLIIDWLALERTRGQAFSVVAMEQEQTIERQGLQLKTRADRVDRLADGSLAVIDYKTGRKVQTEGWFDDRLSEPQLPLYCSSAGAVVGAALLARVRRDATGCRFVGLSRPDDVAPGVGPPPPSDAADDWPGLLAHWGHALDALAQEIVDGRADPTPSAQACEFCALGPLCRVRHGTEQSSDD